MIVRELITLLRFRTAGVDKVDGALDRMEKRVRTLSAAWTGAMGTIAALGVGRLVSQITQAADSLTNLRNRMGVALEDTGESGAEWAQRAIALSESLGTSLNTTSSILLRFGPAMRDAGGTMEDAAQLFQTIVQAGRISGASASETEGLLTQLGQSLSSGVLRGEEFNKMMEEAPILARSLASSLGRPMTDLRKMAEAGELTVEKLLPAFRRMGPEIAQRFSTLAETVDFAQARLTSTWTNVSGELSQAIGFDGWVVRGLNRVREALLRVRAALPDIRAWVERQGGAERLFQRVEHYATMAAAAIALLAGPRVLAAIALLTVRMAPFITALLAIEEIFSWITGVQNSFLEETFGPFAEVMNSPVMRGLSELFAPITSFFGEMTTERATQIAAVAASLALLSGPIITLGRALAFLATVGGGGAVAAAAGTAATAATAAATPPAVAGGVAGILARLGPLGRLGVWGLVAGGAAAAITAAEDPAIRQRSRERMAAGANGARYIGLDPGDLPPDIDPEEARLSLELARRPPLPAPQSPLSMAPGATHIENTQNVTITAPLTVTVEGSADEGVAQEIGRQLQETVERIGRAMGNFAPRTEAPAQ